MPGPYKPFPSLSKKIDEMFEKKHMDLHNERITKAQAKVDSSEPEFMHTNLGHTNPKRMEAERERQYDLDKTNAALLNNLIKIEQQDSSAIIKPALGRTTMTSNVQGMYYPTVNGAQRASIEHINVTATSNPRSLHYRGSNAGSLAGSHAGSLTGSRAASPLRGRSRQPSINGSLADLAASESGQLQEQYSVGGLSGLPPGVPLPIRTSLSGSAGQVWTGQLARRASRELVPTLRSSQRSGSMVLDPLTAAMLVAEASASTLGGEESSDFGLPPRPSGLHAVHSVRSASPNRMAHSADLSAAAPPMRQPSPSRLAKSADLEGASATAPRPPAVPPRPPQSHRTSASGMMPVPYAPAEGPSPPISRRPSLPLSRGPSPNHAPRAPLPPSSGSASQEPGTSADCMAPGPSNDPPMLYSSTGCSRDCSPARTNRRSSSHGWLAGSGAGSAALSSFGGSVRESFALPNGSVLEMRTASELKQDSLRNAYLANSAVVQRGNSVMAVRRSSSSGLPGIRTSQTGSLRGSLSGTPLPSGPSMGGAAGGAGSNGGSPYTPTGGYTPASGASPLPRSMASSTLNSASQTPRDGSSVPLLSFSASPASAYRYADAGDSMLSESGDM